MKPPGPSYTPPEPTAPPPSLVASSLDDRLEQRVDAEPRLGRHAQRLGRIQVKRRRELLGDAIRVGGGEVDLVQHGHDREAALKGQVEVGNGLFVDV